MISDLATLAYLDARIFVNRIRMLIKEPRRLLPWLIFLAWMGWALSARLFYARGRVRTPGLDWIGVLPYLVPGIALAVLGVMVWLRTSRAPAAFSSPADARFLCGSALRPRLVVFWLQVRQMRRQLALWGANVIFWVFVLPFAFQVTASEAFRAAVALALAGSLLVGMQLPVHVAAQRGLAPYLRLLGVGLTAIGLGAVAIGALELASATLVTEPIGGLVTALPPGSWLVGAAEGQVLPFLALAVAAGAAIAASSAAGGDCYPELWQASIRAIAVRRALRQGGLRSRMDARRALREAGIGEQRGPREAVSAAARWVPAGAWTLVWKEWISLRRGPLGLRLAIAILVFAFLAGAGLVVLASLGRRGMGAAGGIATVIVFIGFAGAMAGAVRLGSDLRSPLWWLSAASLRARLAAWTLAGALRASAPFAAAGIGGAVAGRTLLWLGVVPLALAVTWMLRATALAVYSLLPSAFDLAGPGRMLRGIAFYLLVLPLIGVVVLVSLLTRSFVAAGAALLVAAALEGTGLVLLAAWRIKGNGLAFALAERR